MDLSPTLTPKSNQLNADDLIAGPRTITVTKVSPSGNEQQPVAIYFESDNGKPYLPCKSMRRVLVAAWGQDGAAYVGRKMTLFRDPDVSYGGIQVGGIRISHLSDITRDLSIALTVTRSKRLPYKVLKLVETVRPDPVQPAQRRPLQTPPAPTATTPPTSEAQAAPALDGDVLSHTLAQIREATDSTRLAAARTRATELVNSKQISSRDYREILAAISAREAELGGDNTSEAQ